jgi:release factor glutamine methyltransferase
MPDLAHSARSLIAEGCERLRQAGIAEPRRQALWLWAGVSGVSSAEVFIGENSAVRPDHVVSFYHAVERRTRGEPLAHVTGWTGFRHLVLRSDSRALIPRPETEGLVELLLSRVRSGVVADVGTGGGCIALSLAREGGFSKVVGVDCSRDALTQARLNAELMGGSGVVDLVKGDLCTPLRAGGFDALISNPPYLSRAEYAELDNSVRAWEPELALVSGPDGLAATRRLIDEARGVLRGGGWLALEVDCNRAAEVARLATEHGWREVSIHMDLFGRERYLLARRSDTR